MIELYKVKSGLIFGFALIYLIDFEESFAFLFFWNKIKIIKQKLYKKSIK